MKTFKSFIQENYLEEKNVPTSPDKWAQAKAAAKSKFDVYPSAYANAWAAKKYKAMGGGWKSVSEAVYAVKHDGVDKDHPDESVRKLFVDKKNVINHLTKYKDSAERRVKLLKNKGFKNVRIEENVEDDKNSVEQIDEKSPAWQRKEGKSEAGGLNRKGIASYRRENPGSKLSMAVTTKPSKLDPDSKAAKRRKSFCARMSGMKKRLTSAKTANDPDSRINKSLRKWNC